MLIWKNGQPFSEDFDDVYFSTDSGLAEKRHVFLQGNALPERFAALSSQQSFTIAETGFGTGLNFLCACQLFEKTAMAGASLDFFSVEKFPLTEMELQASLALWPELANEVQALLSRWRRRVPGWNHWQFAGGRIRLTLLIDDIESALSELVGAVDAWFLDGFSPAKNPAMWAAPVMQKIAEHSHAGTTLATYSSAGAVRRGLEQAGFLVQKSAGFGRKREMLIGEWIADEASVGARSNAPKTAIVVGGGLAGCAAAYALAQRGLAVTLLDRAAALATAASGNARGILYARFAAGQTPLSRFVLAAYGHALALLDAVLPVDGVQRAECGLLQLATPATEAKRIAKLTAVTWPENVLQAVDAEQASILTGLPMTAGGVWFPAGGWLVPPALCVALTDHPAIEKRFDTEVTSLEKTANGWRVTGDNFALEADVVVVACASQAKRLSQFADFPLQAVRGQISQLVATPASAQLRAVVCAEGYCTPALAGTHVIGATTQFDDESMALRLEDHQENVAQLAEHLPAMQTALGEVDVTKITGRAAVRCSTPGSMPLVGELAAGLFCSLAHGTRGLLTAGIAADIIAAQVMGQLLPLPASVLDALNPQRRRRNPSNKE